MLDPACGTGNFLYVSLELMKRLEGEVLETLARLGVNESLGLERETVDPHQFLGLELNPRAAAIAELVVWIGYLQQHYRTRTGHPAEPILKAFANINFGRREGYDAVLTWDGYPLPTVVEKDGKRIETHPNARRPDWPEAEFIVGNPPFIGKGEPMRNALGEVYLRTLWKTHPHMNESADFVMYWWDRAAELLTRKKDPIRRFGLVTTNSITQVFNRRVVERHMSAKPPASIVFAVADHPWTKSTADAASVRIAMTVGEAGSTAGRLLEVTTESALDSDAPSIDFRTQIGHLNPDLTVGTNLSLARKLLSNLGLANNGMLLAGRGFVLSKSEAEALGGESCAYIKPYINGRELISSRGTRYVIDLFGLSSEEARTQAPAAYQHLLATVKPVRSSNNRDSYRLRWWVFAEPRSEFRPALAGLSRYIATTETTKHRHFQFLNGNFVPDHMVVCFAFSDASMLAILNSRPHLVWSLAAGGTLENRPRYNKARCFDPFPFPAPPETRRQKLRDAGEELDALRKKVLADHPDLTLTGLYNVLEKLKVGEALNEKDEDVKDRGLVLILKELHETIDRLTAEAYGWSADLTDEQILERLVALNAERAKEEAAGHVRWLRPDYQIPRFGKGAAAKTGELDLGETVVAIDRGLPAWPKDRYEQPLAVEMVLVASAAPMDAAAIARAFKGGGRKIESRVAQVLATLARYGRVTPLPTGRFAARKAA